MNNVTPFASAGVLGLALTDAEIDSVGGGDRISSGEGLLIVGIAFVVAGPIGACFAAGYVDGYNSTH